MAITELLCPRIPWVHLVEMRWSKVAGDDVAGDPGGGRASICWSLAGGLVTG